MLCVPFKILNFSFLLHKARMELTMKIDLVRCYYANGNSPTAAIRQLKRERRLIKDPCSCSTVTKLITKFEETGSILNECHGRPSLEEERETAIEEALADSGGKISVRRISNATHIPPTSVYRILKSKKLKPFKIQLLHELKPTDYVQTEEFCQWFLENDDLLPNIFWTDEAYFHLDGGISRHHCRIWSAEKPEEFLMKPLHPENFLCGSALRHNSLSSLISSTALSILRITLRCCRPTSYQS